MIRQYLCQGPHETVGERMAKLQTRADAILAQLSEMDEDNEGAIPLINKLDELDKVAITLRDLPDDHDLGRIGCGADLTDQIKAIPADGDVYTYRCSFCGNTGTARKHPKA